jgi:cysteine desulfurase
MLPYMTDQYGNPSAVYRRGRIVRQAIEAAREQVAQLVGAHESQVIFTSGGTEANNLALKGLPEVRGIAVSAVEHASVLEPARSLRQHCEVCEILVDSMGLVSQEAYQGLLGAMSKPMLVSVMLANNETGVIQDVAALVVWLKSKVCSSILMRCRRWVKSLSTLMVSGCR